jgi:hypothetical protein
MAASFTIAGRNNGFTRADARAATRASVLAYREAMAGFAAMGAMEVWYAHLADDALPQTLQDGAADASRTRKGAKAARRAAKVARKEAAKAPHSRQPAGAVEARRAGRGALPDRQPAADHRAGAGP